MLRQRVITAIVLLVPLSAALIYFPSWALAILFIMAGAMAAWEWAALAGLQVPALRALYLSVLLLLSVISAICTLRPTTLLVTGQADGSAGVVRLLLQVSVLVWVGTLWWISRYPRIQPRPAVRMILGAVLIPAALVGLIRVRESILGIGGLFTLFALVWAADIAAYFAGRAFGRRKLAPRVSPGKTWEGFFGGVLGALAVGVLAGFWILPEPRSWGLWLDLCVAVALISVVGDLTESLLKRCVSVKDSGSLLPGHGGVLDRIDSLLAAAPLMALGLEIMGLAR